MFTRMWHVPGSDAAAEESRWLLLALPSSSPRMSYVSTYHLRLSRYWRSVSRVEDGSPEEPSSSSIAPRSPLGPCFPPLLVVDASLGRERKVADSYENRQEAVYVAALLGRLVRAGLERKLRPSEVGGEGKVVKVGVVTPYRRQVKRILDELGNRRCLSGKREDGWVDLQVRRLVNGEAF